MNNLVVMAADNLVRFYWANVYKDNASCPTLENFINDVKNEVEKLDAGL